jgi:hypothetical protein
MPTTDATCLDDAFERSQFGIARGEGPRRLPLTWVRQKHELGRTVRVVGLHWL